MKDMREALEACESWMDRWTWHVGSCEGGDRCTCGRTAILHEARAALSAVPAPVSEEEIADIICNCFNGDMTFNECAKLVISRLSRTEGEWRPDPKTVEMCAQYHDQSAKDCEAIAKVNQDNDLGADCLTRAADHRIDAMELRSLCQLPDPEESIRTRLDEQAVKSSGGVRTSTENL